ncbi:MAG: CDP-2,3-bis-(O-geranylgeranyl)-sn-glycerol synthase [Candidatus Thermoplasmatota archaeon]|nr:CDP-2,3-bis-(O-geranylgeranyl)-sn-glycerol synthase [Candidatus Thermoplasmatota archaeon]
MADIFLQIFYSLYFFLPAFVANPSAVITKGSTKMDFGRSFRSGRRILGDGKSWGGFAGGILFGYILGLILFGIAYALGSHVNYTFLVPLISIPILMLSLGSMLGDAAGSFIKRRLGMSSGQNGFLLDQYPFALMALLLLYLAAPGFFFHVYWNVPAILIILIITPPLHRAVNIVGFRMKRKSVPW